MKHLGVPNLGVGREGLDIAQYVDHYIGVEEDMSEILTPFVNIVPLYLLAYWIAIHKGINPDILRTDNRIRRETYKILMPPGSH
jgi:glucosamine 6-phosphate synthetase-like amidotransferase/phosphosugar isomerase protein